MAATPEFALNIVVPMAGLGSRFQQAGYTVPKPLIEVRGRPMYAWAADSLPLASASRLIFILLASQPEFPQLRDDIRRRYSKHNPIVLDVPALTAGQAVTVLQAKEFIANDEALLIHNADTAFTVAPGWVGEAWRTGCDGALLVFRSDESRWSYSREGPDGWVTEVREKQVISPWASTGTYWFRRGADFVRLAEERVRTGRREAAEYYVGPLFNDLIAAGAHVKNFPIQRLFCFGTPEDYERTVRELERAGTGEFPSTAGSRF
jgi:NDP-sugar pyrophosphorylase family protein